MNDRKLWLLLAPISFYARVGDAPAYPGAGTPTATDSDDFAANDQIINIGKDIPKFGNRQNTFLRYVMDNIARKNTVQETFSHKEEPQQPVMVKYTGVDESSQNTTSIVIENWQRLVDGHRIFFPRTGEIIRVAATPTSSAVSVSATERDFGTNTGGLLKRGDVGYIMTKALPQGSSIGDSREHGLVNYDFQTGIIDEVVRQTGTRAAQRRIDGMPVWQVAFDNTMDRLNRLLEVAMIMSRGIAPTVDTNISVHPIHVSMGIDEWSSSLRYVFNRRVNRFDFDDMLLQLARENDLASWESITLLCSTAFKSQVSSWADARVQLPQDIASLGSTIERIKTGAGHVVDLLPVSFLDRDPLMQGRAWIFNRANIRYRPLVDDLDRDVRYYPDPTADLGNTDFVAGRVIGEFGYEFFNKEGFISIEGMVV